MNWFTKLITGLRSYFKTGKAAQDAQTALTYVAKALPYVIKAADFITKATATPLDDIAWAAIKAKYPEIFDGTPKTPEALYRSGLQIAATELRKDFPELGVGISLAAAQLAWFDYKEMKKPAAPATPPATAP